MSDAVEAVTSVVQAAENDVQAVEPVAELLLKSSTQVAWAKGLCKAAGAGLAAVMTGLSGASVATSSSARIFMIAMAILSGLSLFGTTLGAFLSNPNKAA